MAEETKHKYKLPEDNAPQMVEDALISTNQYTKDLQSGIEILKCASPEELHNIIIFLTDFTQSRKNSNNQKARFEEIFEKWWLETCMYSGPNLCLSNPHFFELKAMGATIIPYIADKERTAPDFMQRHIGWLKKEIAR